MQNKLKFREIPALCGSCGNLFGTQIKYQVEAFDQYGNVNLQILGMEGTSPCTNCGSEAEWRTDLVSFAEQAFTVLKTLSVDRLMVLQQSVKDLHKTDINPDEFEKLKNTVVEAVPELQSFKDLMPKTRSEAYTVIGIFLTVIGFVISFFLAGAAPTNEDKRDTINVVFNSEEIEVELPQEVPPIAKKIPTKKTVKQKPNDWCACGSKVKYKKCHGVR